jgi:hypothetical protein
MTITRQQTWNMRKRGSIPGIGKGVVSTPKRPDRLHTPLFRLAWGTGRSSCYSKTAGTWRCRLLYILRKNLVVPSNTVCFNAVKQLHFYYDNARNSTYCLGSCLVVPVWQFHQLGTRYQLPVNSHKNYVTKKSYKHVHTHFCDILILRETIKRDTKLLLEKFRCVFRKNLVISSATAIWKLPQWLPINIVFIWRNKRLHIPKVLTV